MTRRDDKLTGKPLEYVADVMAGCEPGSMQDQMAKSEFYLRQTDAQVTTAESTRKYTRYMFWSVVVLTLSSLANLVISLLCR